MRRDILRAVLLLAVTAGIAGSSSCTSAVRQGTGSSYLIIDGIGGVRGGSEEETANLISDVVTIITEEIDGEDVRYESAYSDGGVVTFRLGLKDAGSASSPTSPTTNNFITVNRYRVTYVRTDGRNTPGVDVPHPFEGAITVTVGAETVETGFMLVRLQAKSEAPLLALRGGGGAYAISTIAEVTFYGHDQTGHAVSATGSISIEFADWADEE